jgi:micrococcal nuclease
MSVPAPPSPMPEHLWVKPARCIGVVDGDTIDVVLDLGKRTYAEDRLRLLNVNAPERKGATLAAGNESRGYVVDWMTEAGTGPFYTQKDWPLRVQTFKDDVFGRYLALVWRVSDGACLNDDLITSGMARVDIR